VQTCQTVLLCVHFHLYAISVYECDEKTEVVSALKYAQYSKEKTVSAVKWTEFVSDKMAYIVMGGRWCNVIVLNVQTPSKEKNDDSKECCCEELEQVFDHFHKYHREILLGDCMQNWRGYFQTDNWE
jgi:hypothetical protein